MTNNLHLEIDLSRQQMQVIDRHGNRLKHFAVSTAANGAGENRGSGCTPRGEHIVRAKIGEGAVINTIFRGRRPSGEIYQLGMRAQQPGRDWILTRIIWLSGTQPGFNRLGSVDTMRRYIYIHGTPDEVQLGVSGSAGCVRMGNAELLELFDLVTIGTRVFIQNAASNTK